MEALAVCGSPLKTSMFGTRELERWFRDGGGQKEGGPGAGAGVRGGRHEEKGASKERWP